MRSMAFPPPSPPLLRLLLAGGSLRAVAAQARRALHAEASGSPTFHITTYGCQMNFADADVVRAVLARAGYRERKEPPGVLTPAAGCNQEAKDAQDSLVDVYLVNTCAIRDAAEARVANHLRHARGAFAAAAATNKRNHERTTPPVIAVLGCMAERVKADLLAGDEPLADAVCGPDAYRDLPRLIDVARRRRGPDATDEPAAMNVKLSNTETYADLAPTPTVDDDAHAVRPAIPTATQHYVSIMRGCANHCSFCVVPKTRGPERSRDAMSVLRECYVASHEGGVREITLLGQNVNSYVRPSDDATAASATPAPQPALREINALIGDVLQRAMSDVQGMRAAAATEADGSHHDHDHDHAAPPSSARAFTSSFYTSPGFATRYRPAEAEDAIRFAELLLACSYLCPNTRFRFTSPHPKDFPLDLLKVIATRPNICKQLHLPLQSGNDRVLAHMRRGYTRAAFLDLVHRARRIIGDGVALSTDVISGFSSESSEEHDETVRVMREVGFEQAFTFAYSERPGTPAHRRALAGETSFVDDVAAGDKRERLEACAAAFREGLLARNATVEPGRVHLVLVEGKGRDEGQMRGRTDTNRVAVWEGGARLDDGTRASDALKPGDFVACRVERAEVHTLFVEPLAHVLPTGVTNAPPRSAEALAAIVGAPEHFARRRWEGTAM